jgi:hypothetical protein
MASVKGIIGAMSSNSVDVGVEVVVGRQHPGDDLGLTVITVREKRSQTSVDYAAGEDLALGRTAFSFEKTTGDASTGVRVFPVIHRQGQEIYPLALAFFRAGGNQHHGIAHADDG